MTVPLIDTHCHLNFPPLSDDLPAVLARAAQAGVRRVVVPSYDHASWSDIVALHAAHPGVVHPAYGLHPWVAHEPLDRPRLATLLAHPATVALGEVGLDTKIDSPGLDVQLAVLTAQLDLAVDHHRPVILHCRGAFEELLVLLQRYTPCLRGIIHAYSRGPELAARFLDLGLCLGIGGAATRPRAKQMQSTLRKVPLERLVLETDAPSIGLDGVEPADVEPRHVREVAQAIAAARGVDVGEVGVVTSGVADGVFGFAAV